MSSEPAISIRGLTKTYRIRTRQPETTLAATLRQALRRSDSREEFQALAGIDLDVLEGDVVGLIGRNGAGKSTLLKVLSRITPPSAGSVEIFGRVGSLLEVGTGFHPELTGRENIYLNGSLLGMSSRAVRTRFDDIVAFAGTEKFLDTPVKRYSSGMYVRLAFAVAAHLDVDVLLVDEVLAVGDSEFQARCLGKMRDISQSGRTVVFVSHQMQSVLNLCRTAVWLEQGRIQRSGPVAEVVREYTRSFAAPSRSSLPSARPGTGEVRITRFDVLQPTYAAGEPIRINIALEPEPGYSGQFFASVAVIDEGGNTLYLCDSRLVNRSLNASVRELTLTIRSPWLKPGRYTVNAALAQIGPLIDVVDSAGSFTVVPVMPYPGTVPEDAYSYGLTFADFDFG